MSKFLFFYFVVFLFALGHWQSLEERGRELGEGFPSTHNFYFVKELIKEESKHAMNDEENCHCSNSALTNGKKNRRRTD